MSVNEDSLQPSSDSFWEVDCYKRTVKRQDEGPRLCHDLTQLIQERADIEKHYAKSLKAWSKKWQESIEKGPEYGTTEAAWKAVLSEADSRGDLHIAIKDRLLNEVQAEIKQWKSDNYHKPMVGPYKETKQLEDEFRKAQKPWAKRLSKVMDARKKYHTACKLEKSATNQESNARSDSSLSGEQLKKIQDKADKCRKDVEAAKEKYEATLNDLNAYNAKYMEDMSEVFNKSQEMEEKRLNFIKEQLFGLHSCLDISQNIELQQIYAQFKSTVEKADSSQDLKWWSQNHGMDMPMNWPTFEEYSADFHTISRKEKKAGGSSEGITITAIKKNDNGAPSSRPQSQVYNNHAASTTQATPPLQSQQQNAQNPFGEDDWEEDFSDEPARPVDDGSTGVPVRAIYDYEGQEEDELTFKVGEVFVKLKDRDDQGWCTGRKDGRVGLFPDNYVEET